MTAIDYSHTDQNGVPWFVLSDWVRANQQQRDRERMEAERKGAALRFGAAKELK